MDIIGKTQAFIDDQQKYATESSTNDQFIVAGNADEPNLTLADLELLVLLAEQQPEELVERLNNLADGWHARIRRQVESINRLLRRFSEIRRIIDGGGSDGGKVIEIRKVLP